MGYFNRRRIFYDNYISRIVETIEYDVYKNISNVKYYSIIIDHSIVWYYCGVAYIQTPHT